MERLLSKETSNQQGEGQGEKTQAEMGQSSQVPSAT